MEAVQAISMLHEQVYYDRKLSVQMAKASQFEEISGRKKEDKKETKLPRGLQSLGMGLGIGGGAMKDISSKIIVFFYLCLWKFKTSSKLTYIFIFCICTCTREI